MSSSRGPQGGGFRGGRGGRGDRGGFHGGRAGRSRGRGDYLGSSGASSMSPFFSTVDGRVPPPDASITATEDAIHKGENKLQMLSLKQTLPMRPGYGTKGSPVILWANYVQMTPRNLLSLYRHDVSVSPAAVGKKLNQIVRLLVESDDLIGLRQDIVTDFKSTLISREKLPNDEMVVPIVYRAEGEDEPREKATRYNVRVKFTHSLSISELTEYLTSTNLTAPFNDKLPMVQSFNILLKHYSKEAGSLATIGASKTFPLGQGSDKYDLGRGLEAIRGFFASVRAATGRVLVNVNISNAAFYKSGPLDDLMSAFMQSGNKFRLESFLKRVRIRTTHLKERKNKKGELVPRIKTIHGLASTNDGSGLAQPPQVPAYGAGPKQVKFWLEDQTQVPLFKSQGMGKKQISGGNEPGRSSAATAGKYISVYEFFKNVYGIQLRRSDLPVINAGTRASPTYLPSEVCVIVPGQAAKSKLDSNQTQAMIRFAVRKPGDNARSIVGQGLQVSGLDTETNPLLDRFGISVSASLITVPGRILSDPKIVYRRQSAQVRFGSWNMNDVQFNKPSSLKKWSYLLISLPGFRDAFDAQSLGQTIKTFGQALMAAGISVAAPLAGQRLELSDMDDACLDDKMEAAARNLELLLIILPDTPIPIYNRIKNLGDVKYGIHTICTVGHKMAKEKGQDQYMTNVALKFNLKLGGNNQLLEDSRLGIVREDKTMVVGIDVTHPSPGSSSKAPSIAGMVANVDKFLGQWPATLSIQSTARQEMVSDLEVMLRSRLSLWKRKGGHKEYPENILVYRDGVSEGQYQKVLDEELPLLRKACANTYPPADQRKGLPRFTIVIVGKRHHTRFYPTRQEDADKSSNSKAGTVVDRGVTEARNWDFFLQAHAAIQGTARPAHYFVVIDEIFRHRYKVVPQPYRNVADILEELTQAMCYIFGRATKAVSICTPAYYADILCERARCYLSGVFETPTRSAAPSIAGSEYGTLVANKDVEIHERLRDTMFYI